MPQARGPWTRYQQSAPAPAPPWLKYQGTPESSAAASSSEPASVIGDIWHGLVHGVGNVLGGLEQANQADVAANRGKTFAQRILAPAGMAAATNIALSFAPGNIGEGTGFGAVREPKPPSVPEQRIAELKKAGVTPNVALTGSGKATKLLAKMGEKVPLAGAPIRKGMTKALGETAAAAEREAAKLGVQQTPTEVASETHAGLERFTKDRTAAKENYAPVDRLMHGAPASTLPATSTVTQDIAHRFSDLEDLNAFFNTPIAKKVLGTLTPTVEQIPEQRSALVDASGRPIITRPAQTITHTPAAHWNDIKQLRSEIGSRLRNLGQSANPQTRAQFKRLYGALTNDMMALARSRGPEATEAFLKASREYAAQMKIIDQIAPLVRRDNPDRTFADINMAAREIPGTGGTSNLPLLRAAKTALKPQEWQDVGAAMIRRLGTPAAGARVPGGLEFSTASFVTNWNKLSPEAKKLLFSPQTRDALDRVARISGYQSEVARLENFSHSGDYVIAGAILDRVMQDVARHGIAGAAKAAGTLGGGYLVAKTMMSPKFASFLARLPRMMHEGVGIDRMAMSLLRMTGTIDASDIPPAAPKPRSPQVGDKGPQGGTVTGQGANAL